MTTAISANSAVTKVVQFILDRGIEGVPPLSSASDLAQEYLLDQSYADNDNRTASLIRWETAKSFTSGFLTGLGGVVTMPISVPAALGASWIVQARMAGAIAQIYGHRLSSDRVRTFVLLSIAGDSAKNIMKETGINVGRKLAERAIAQVPGRALIEINRYVGFRLVAKAGEKGVVNLSNAVPIAGGLVGGSLDALACRVVGRTAVELFKR